MMTHKILTRLRQVAAAALFLSGVSAHAQLVINDTLTGASTAFKWVSLNGACLTAGDGTGSIPACIGLPYYGAAVQVGGTTGRLPDVAGSGALRLSNGAVDNGSGGTNQTGAVVSRFTFPTNQGVQVTWTSVTYGGNNYNGTGADGISFFLSDGGGPTDSDGNATDAANHPLIAPSVGGLGGSLGYSCSNGNSQYDGVIAGYLGIGIDEFGNFANPGDNTDTGPGFQARRIGVRGAGSTAWSALQANPLYSKYYPGATNANAIHKTCRDGYAYNYSGVNQTDSTGAVIGNGNKTGDKLAFNYPLLFSLDLPTGVVLANQQATNMPTRGAGVPIIFSLKITADGLLDFFYSVCPASSCGATQTVVAGLKITDSNGPLPGYFRFGFSAGTGGGSNVHEITCFKATPANLANSSAGSNAQQAGQIVLGGVQVFLAYYHPINWWGSLTANTVQFDSANNRLTIASTSSWDASCVLTGGACPATGAALTAQAPTSRTILSWNNLTGTSGAGIPFEWTSTGGLTSAEKTTLGSSNRVDFLRGSRAREVTAGGSFRNRTSVLGDIIDSSPTWVGAPAFNYSDPWVDKLATSTTMPEGSTSYAGFSTTYANRMNVVYTGANDGMMHGFRAGIVSSDGTSISSNDGHELLAYVPGQVINAIHPSSAAFDYSNTAYLHNFQVDATPGYGDLYYSGAWHTWLVSGLGPGGHPGGAVNSNGTDGSGNQLIPDPVGAVFALDITDPGSFAESSAASLVIGEWNSSTISCTGNTTCGTNLGQVYGTPLVRRLHDGSWGVIWGNGLNSPTARAGIFIMHVSTTGAKTFQYIDAGPGPANGIVEVTAADLDGDHVTDFVYAGDVLGNLWRFDLTSATNTSWAAATKLFTAATGQPITTAPVVAEIPAGNSTGKSKLLIAFGTGQKLPLTGAASEVYASGTQSVYGIWDASLSTWNGTSTDEKYDALTSPTLPIARSLLVTRTLTNVVGTDGSTFRTVSPADGTICWEGSTICSSGNTQMGYKMDLPGSGEQVVYNPTLIDDSFVYNSVIPQSSQPLTCGNTPAAGFTMTTSIINGSGDNAPYTDGTNYYAGVAQNGAGVVSEFHYNGQSYDGTETNDGRWTSRNRPPRGGQITPVTWTKVR